MYAPVQALAPPCTRRLLNGQGFQGFVSLSTDYGWVVPLVSGSRDLAQDSIDTAEQAKFTGEIAS